MKRLPLVVHTVYSELADLCRIAGQEPAFRPLGGSLVKVPVDGRGHWYYQSSRRTSPGKHQRREYIGPVGDEEVESKVKAFGAAKSAWNERAELVSTLKASGAPAPTGKLAGLLLGLAEHGVLRRSVLVGTVAFQAYGPLLGVRFGQSSFQTLDLDLAPADETILQVVPRSQEGSLLEILQRIDPSFQGVPGLHRSSPPASYMNGSGLRVDVLVPLLGPETETLPATSLGSHAQAQRFLDYLLESPVEAVLLIGGGIMATVPNPARFAFHKLLVANRRPAVETGKRRKDLLQAEQLLSVLLEDNPDQLQGARDDLMERGPGWRRTLEQGLDGLQDQLLVASLKEEIQ